MAFDASGSPRSVPGDFSFRATFAPCYGICPAYDVALTRDGAVDYVGTRCVQRAGPLTTQLDDASVRELVGALGALRFFDLPNRRAEDLTVDEDAVHTTEVVLVVTVGGAMATVRDGHNEVGGRPDWLVDLRRFEDEVPARVGVDAWVGDIDWTGPIGETPCDQ